MKTKTKIKLMRWSASILGAGYLFQATSCTANQDTLASVLSEVVVRQTANLMSDVVFFVLDNALVRLTN